MDISEIEDQQNSVNRATEQPRSSSRTHSYFTRKSLCVKELCDMKGSKIGLSVLKGSKRKPSKLKRGRSNLSSKAKNKSGFFTGLDEPEQCGEGNALQQQNLQQFEQPRCQESPVIKIKSLSPPATFSLSGPIHPQALTPPPVIAKNLLANTQVKHPFPVSSPSPANDAPPPGFSTIKKGANTEEVKLELCAEFCEKGDYLYMGDRTQVKKVPVIPKSNIIFNEEGYNSLYQRICSSRGRPEGSVEVNDVIKLQLTQILKVVEEMENINLMELKEDKLKEWELIVGIGIYLKFDIDWLHNALKQVTAKRSNRSSLKEAAHTADEQVANLEREVALAKRDWEIKENEYQLTKRHLKFLEGKVDSAMANWAALMQAKDGAFVLQTEAYACLQESMMYELKV